MAQYCPLCDQETNCTEDCKKCMEETNEEFYDELRMEQQEQM